MKFYQRKRRTPAVIIVALIDIFAILLIFVIVTTTFRRTQPSVVIRLPESSSAQPAPADPAAPQPVVVAVSAGGAIFVDARETPAGELTAALRGVVAAKRPLALEADTNAPFGVVIRVMDSLKEAGVTGNLPAFTEIRKKGP